MVSKPLFACSFLIFLLHKNCARQPQDNQGNRWQACCNYQAIPGIDVIVGGDTHNLLDSTGEMARMNLPVSGEYPTIVTDPRGNNVYIVQAWDYARGLGILDLIFDESGNVTQVSGRTVLPVGVPFMVRNEENQFVASTPAESRLILNAILESPVLAAGVHSRTIDTILNPMRAEIERSMTATIVDEAIRYSQGITQSTGAFPYAS